MILFQHTRHRTSRFIFFLAVPVLLPLFKNHYRRIRLMVCTSKFFRIKVYLNQWNICLSFGSFSKLFIFPSFSSVHSFQAGIFSKLKVSVDPWQNLKLWILYYSRSIQVFLRWYWEWFNIRKFANEQNIDLLMRIYHLIIFVFSVLSFQSVFWLVYLQKCH